MNERTKLFKEASERELTTVALTKEINTLRKFLFRNQNHQFTSAERLALLTAVCNHCNRYLKSRDPSQEDNIVGLMEDALKMPPTLFASSDKNKLLSLYNTALPDSQKDEKATRCTPERRLRVLELLDVDEDESQLLLLEENGEPYADPITVPQNVLKEIQRLTEVDENVVMIRIQEGASGAPLYQGHDVATSEE